MSISMVLVGLPLASTTCSAPRSSEAAENGGWSGVEQNALRSLMASAKRRRAKSRCALAVRLLIGTLTLDLGDAADASRVAPG